MADLLKLVTLVLALVFIFGMGIAHIVNPDYFIKRSGVPKGGEMPTDWNRTSFRALGAVLVGGILYFVYSEFLAPAKL